MTAKPMFVVNSVCCGSWLGVEVGVCSVVGVGEVAGVCSGVGVGSGEGEGDGNGEGTSVRVTSSFPSKKLLSLGPKKATSWLQFIRILFLIVL